MTEFLVSVLYVLLVTGFVLLVRNQLVYSAHTRHIREIFSFEVAGCIEEHNMEMFAYLRGPSYMEHLFDLTKWRYHHFFPRTYPRPDGARCEDVATIQPHMRLCDLFRQMRVAADNDLSAPVQFNVSFGEEVSVLSAYNVDGVVHVDLLIGDERAE